MGRPVTITRDGYSFRYSGHGHTINVYDSNGHEVDVISHMGSGKDIPEGEIIGMINRRARMYKSHYAKNGFHGVVKAPTKFYIPKGVAERVDVTPLKKKTVHGLPAWDLPDPHI